MTLLSSRIPENYRIHGDHPQIPNESNPQLKARNYFETPDHPVVGAMPLPSLPFRYASLDHWLRSAAPTLGQHNEHILQGILHLSDKEILELNAQGIIGKRLEGD